MTLSSSTPRKPLISLDAVFQAIAPDATPHSREAIALGLIVRAGWPFPESREAWGSRFARLRAAIADGRFACCFDRVGRLVGGASWDDDLAAGGVRIADFWARRGSARAVVAELRSSIGNVRQGVTYQRTVRGVACDRRYLFAGHRANGAAAARTHAAKPAGMTDRQDLLDSCADALARAREHGEILTVLASSRAYAALPTSAALHLATLWSGLHQYRLYRDDDGNPSGLLAWAWLSDRTIADLPRAPLHRLPFSEWNEGERLCLSDIIVSAATREALSADIAGALFPAEAELLTYRYADAQVTVTPWQACDRPRLAQLAVPAPA